MPNHRPKAFITGLNPGHWYKLIASASNSAGSKDVEFDFLTRRIENGMSQGLYIFYTLRTYNA